MKIQKPSPCFFICFTMLLFISANPSSSFASESLPYLEAPDLSGIDESLIREAYLYRDPKEQIHGLYWDEGNIQIIQMNEGEQLKTYARIQGQFPGKNWSLTHSTKEARGKREEKIDWPIEMDANGKFTLYLLLTGKFTPLEVTATNPSFSGPETEKNYIFWRYWNPVHRDLQNRNRLFLEPTLGIQKIFYSKTSSESFNTYQLVAALNVRYDSSPSFEWDLLASYGFLNFESTSSKADSRILGHFMGYYKFQKTPSHRFLSSVASWKIGLGAMTYELNGLIPLQFGPLLMPGARFEWGLKNSINLLLGYVPLIGNGHDFDPFNNQSIQVTVRWEYLLSKSMPSDRTHSWDTSFNYNITSLTEGAKSTSEACASIQIGYRF